LQDAHFALLVGTAIANTQRQTDFSGANLSDSVMFNADLSGIDAQKADLDGTTLYDVNLSSADLGRASLRGATIGGAAYPRSSLKPEGTGLGPVDLRGANLANARLEGADLRGAYLFGAQLSGATADKHTKLPPGFELSRDGHHVIEQPGYVPGLLAPVPVPESPCPPDSRPQRFG